MVFVPTSTIPTGGVVAPAVARDDGGQPIVRAQLPADGVDRGARPGAGNVPVRSGPTPDAPGSKPKADIWSRLGPAIGAFFAGGSVAWGALICLGLGPFGLGVLAASALVGVVAAKATDNYMTRGSVFPLFGSGSSPQRQPQPAT
jgi:hypothetical protein